MTGTSLLTYWYFHLPNFILAALMYTLLGRALLGLIAQPDSGNYIWRFFCRITDPVVAVVALVTPKAAAPVVIWLFGVVWLFWLRFSLWPDCSPSSGLNPPANVNAMDRKLVLHRHRIFRNGQRPSFISPFCIAAFLYSASVMRRPVLSEARVWSPILLLLCYRPRR